VPFSVRLPKLDSGELRAVSPATGRCEGPPDPELHRFASFGQPGSPGPSSYTPRNGGGAVPRSYLTVSRRAGVASGGPFLLPERRADHRSTSSRAALRGPRTPNVRGSEARGTGRRYELQAPSDDVMSCRLDLGARTQAGAARLAVRTAPEIETARAVVIGEARYGGYMVLAAPRSYHARSCGARAISFDGLSNLVTFLEITVVVVPARSRAQRASNGSPHHGPGSCWRRDLPGQPDATRSAPPLILEHGRPQRTQRVPVTESEHNHARADGAAAIPLRAQ
jgi:hypothetical protein